MPQKFFLPVLLLLLTAIVFSGCSQSSAIPVSAKIRFEDGAPVTGKSATVLLFPAPSNASQNPSPVRSGGELNEKGEVQFKVSREQPGLIPGEYKVVLHVAADDPPTQWVVDAKYRDAATTPLTLKVERGGKNQFEFKVPRLKK